MVLAVVGVVIQAGTLNLQQIVLVQNHGKIFGWDGIGNPFLLTQFIGFIVFMISVRPSSPRRRSTCPSPSPSSCPAT